MNNEVAITKVCVRCRNIKPITDYNGVRGVVKTCVRCRGDGSRNSKHISKDKRALYNKAYVEKHGRKKVDRREYMRQYRLRKIVEKQEAQALQIMEEARTEAKKK